MVLSAVKRKAAGRAHTRQEGGWLGRGDREPLWGSGLCACWLPLPQQGRIFAETAIPKTDITHRPRGHMCPVRCQYLTSGPQGQGYKLLLHRWPSESYLSFQRPVSSSIKWVKYKIIYFICCRGENHMTLTIITVGHKQWIDRMSWDRHKLFQY